MGAMEPFEVELSRREGYEFNVAFPGKPIPGLQVDEVAPVGTEHGPNPARMLAAAVGHCLSSSLIFCLSKAHIDVGDVETKVHGEMERNERGRWRIKGLRVELMVAAQDLGRCKELFEDFCIVTESVRKGIPVDVAVNGAAPGPTI